MLSSLKGSKKKKEKRRRSISASPSISVDPPSSSASSLQDEPSWGTFDEMSMEELSDDEGAILFTEVPSFSNSKRCFLTSRTGRSETIVLYAHMPNLGN